MKCGEPVRGFPGETCKLDAGHRGYHSCVVFTCDTCGRTLRGQPYTREDVYAYGERDDTFAFCFLCAGPPAERRDAHRDAELIARWEAEGGDADMTTPPPNERAQARAMLRQILILEATADDPFGRIARERADVEALLTDFDVGIVRREVRERLGLDPNETPNERNPE